MSEISAGDLTDWAAYAEMEPFGPNAGFYQAATVASAALMPWTSKGKKLPDAGDWFPHLKTDEVVEAQSPELMRAMCLAWAAASGGEIIGVKD